MDYWPFILIVIAVIFSAFFSGMEIAFISANRLKIELDFQRRTFSGKILSHFVRQDSRFIATMLLGNNIALVVYSIWMAVILDPWILPLVGGSESLTLLIQTILSALLILVTSEFLPKALFQINPNQVLRILTVPLSIIYLVLYPFTLFTILLSDAIMRLFGIKSKNTKPVFSKVDLDEYVRDLNERMDEKGGELDNEMEILQNALGFSEIKVRDCMVPRTDVIAVDIETPVDVLLEKFIKTGLSKILIFRDNIDNIIGYVHCFELFKKPEEIKNVLIPIAFVPEAALAKNLLEVFAKQHGNIAVVVDEYGGTSGVVTIEDVLEQIFGDIEDEHDNGTLYEEMINENSYLFSARQEIDYLNNEYSLGLKESTEYETLGGLIISHTESIPVEGTKLEIDDYVFEIVEVSDRKIERVKITKNT